MDATQDSLLFLFPAAATLFSPLLAVLLAALSLLWLYPGGPAWALISRSRATPPGTPGVVTAPWRRCRSRCPAAPRCRPSP
jgi:cytochrome P450 family 78 subfamily A